jgi:uncharacterized protein (TIGR03435 family)
MRAAVPILMTCGCWLAFGQTPEPAPKFEAADVHASPKVQNPFFRNSPVRGGRYELKNATMVDLIRIAYGFEPNKILGGPSWLEMDRFDVTAKVPEGTTPEDRNLMLQALLADRFKLVVHKEMRRLPTYALTVGKKPQLKPADVTEEPGCHTQSEAGPADDRSISFITSDADGKNVTVRLGAGMTIRYACRNMTMAAFAAGLRGMMGAGVGPNEILDETGLKGNWNFDVKWTLTLVGPMDGSQHISTFDAIEKQLGLKLDPRDVPTSVIVVDSVNETPSPNPPGLEKSLPKVSLPVEFEVASIKPFAPDGRMGGSRFQPGGLWTVEGMPLSFLIRRAFNTMSTEAIAGMPSWADTARYDIVAKAPSIGPSAPAMDMESAGPMILALLKDRFKLAYHTEQRPVSAYALVAVKPKMRKADPASRASCKTDAAPASAPPSSLLVTCRNISMTQFADRLRTMGPGISWPVLDATELEGGWDFSLTYSRRAGQDAIAGRGPRAIPGEAMPNAPEPTGALTLFEAVEKQLGLKLESRKRPMPVIVIDHLEQKPTEN